MEVVITRKGMAVELPTGEENFNSLIFTVDGFLSSFTFNGVKYRFYNRNNALPEDKNRSENLYGYYRVDKYSSYLLRSTGISGRITLPDLNYEPGYRFDFERYKAIPGTLITVKKIYFEYPYNTFYKHLTATFNLEDKNYLKNSQIDIPENLPAENISIEYNEEGEEHSPGGYFYHVNLVTVIDDWSLSPEEGVDYARIVTYCVFKIRVIVRDIFPWLSTSEFESITADSEYESLSMVDKIIYYLLEHWGYFHDELDGLPIPSFDRVLPLYPILSEFQNYYTKLNSFAFGLSFHFEELRNLDEKEKLMELIRLLPIDAISLIDIDIRIEIISKLLKHQFLGDDRFSEQRRLELYTRIIQSVSTSNATYFLTQLFTLKVAREFRFRSIFRAIFEDVQYKVYGAQEDKTELMYAILGVWYSSDFNPENAFGNFENNDELTDEYFDSFINKPIFIPYNSEKNILNFLDDNMNFNFASDSDNIQVRADWWMNKLGEYHPYQAITLNDISENDFSIKIPLFNDGDNDSTLIPIYFLVYMDYVGDAEDLRRAIGLTFEIALTFTGIGNLTKLRHLKHITSLGRLSIGKAVADDVVILAINAIQGVATVVELSAFVAKIILDYYTEGCSIYREGDPTDPLVLGVNDIINDDNPNGIIPEQPTNPDYEWCKNLDQFLFWVMIASAGINLLAHVKVRQISRKIIRDGVPADFNPLALDYMSNFVQSTDLIILRGRFSELPALLNEIDIVAASNPALAFFIGDTIIRRNIRMISILESSPLILREVTEISQIAVFSRNINVFENVVIRVDRELPSLLAGSKGKGFDYYSWIRESGSVVYTKTEELVLTNTEIYNLINFGHNKKYLTSEWLEGIVTKCFRIKKPKLYMEVTTELNLAEELLKPTAQGGRGGRLYCFSNELGDPDIILETQFLSEFRTVVRKYELDEIFEGQITFSGSVHTKRIPPDVDLVRYLSEFKMNRLYELNLRKLESLMEAEAFTPFKMKQPIFYWSNGTPKKWGERTIKDQRGLSLYIQYYKNSYSRKKSIYSNQIIAIKFEGGVAKISRLDKEYNNIPSLNNLNLSESQLSKKLDISFYTISEGIVKGRSIPPETNLKY